ncbi:MAG: hypothetical protein SGPRY_006360 [Prymnesium sp.]
MQRAISSMSSPSYEVSCIIVICSAGLGGVRLLVEAVGVRLIDAADLAAVRLPRVQSHSPKTTPLQLA